MEYTNIPKDKFRFADPNRRTGDKKFDTKPMSYAKDVFKRFCKNKSSVVAAIIIILLVLFSLITPLCYLNNRYTNSKDYNDRLKYQFFLPKNPLFEGTGFWDGGKDYTGAKENQYNIWQALEQETGHNVITKVDKGPYYEYDQYGNQVGSYALYDVRVDTYTALGMTYLSLAPEDYEALIKWQDKEGVQVIYPAVDTDAKRGSQYLILQAMKGDPNVWYETDRRGNPLVDENGKLTPVYETTKTKPGYTLANGYYYGFTDENGEFVEGKRLESDPGNYIYAVVEKVPTDTGVTYNYKVRVDKYALFEYTYGFEPYFLLGTNGRGDDMITKIAQGAQFSLVLAVCISAVNLFIGAIYGAIEGFYGGVTDLVMERISDILGGIPTMVVMTLFQLHLASKVGPVWSMVFAFILTGWLGMAARTRMQFYRFKRQEYVLSARTLGASDSRLMFKHIFPNAMGTLITGSVLSIPGVIFSESSLTYLGIVNLESSEATSLGTLIAKGAENYIDNPHVLFYPALFISLLEISFNLFGNGLRDAFNPSLKGIED